MTIQILFQAMAYVEVDAEDVEEATREIRKRHTSLLEDADHGSVTVLNIQEAE